MKAIICLIFCTSLIHLNAKSILRQSYNIKSDVVDETVQKGKCRVSGTASHAGQPLINSLISTLDGKKRCFSDSLGHYSLLLDDSDTSIFFYHKEYDEQVIWNYNFQSQHHVEIDFYANLNTMIQAVDKPVIYLYSETDIDVALRVDFKGEMSFSYPQLEKDEWYVTVSDSGLFSDGISLPYLFWEGEMAGLTYEFDNEKIPGEILASDQVVEYLEDILGQAGFNQNEKTDFITFWAPKLIQNEYVFIQFLQDDGYSEKIASLAVHPKPDNSMRLYMLYSGFDQIPSTLEVVPQSFEKVTRSGFTLIDWGGSEINPTMIKL